MVSRPSISTTRFRETYGDEAFEAVEGDIDGFKVDLGLDMIHIIPIDLLSEVEDIVIDHYRFESKAGFNYELEPVEWMRRGRGSLSGYASMAILVVLSGEAERIKSLISRILSEVGVNATVVILRRVNDEEKE